MKPNSDPLYKKYSKLDFGDAKPVSEISALACLQAEQRRQVKSPVTLRLDADVATYFRSSGRGWQTRINEILRQWVGAHELVEHR